MSRPTAGKRAVRRRYAILGVLADIGPANAIAIADKLARNGGAIYADLVWMEHHGLIVSEWEEAVRAEVFYDPKLGTHKPRPRRRLYRPASESQRCSCGCHKTGDGCDRRFCNEPYPTTGRDAT